MTFLLDDPTPIIVIGILAEAILAVALVRTRRGVLLWAMGGVLAAVVIGLVVQRLVVTEKKRVKATLYGIAAAVERNDQKAVASYLSRSASDILRRVVTYMNRLEFTDVSLRGMEITINDLTSPPTAVARFHATVHFNDRLGEALYNTYPADFEVLLVLEDGQWKVQTAEDDNLSPLARDIR